MTRKHYAGGAPCPGYIPQAPDLREQAIAAALALLRYEAEHGQARTAQIRRLEDRWLLACDRAGMYGAEALSLAQERMP